MSSSPRPVRFGNILTVASREFTWRARTRTFIITTVVLAVIAAGLALAPVLVRLVDRNSTEKIGVYVAAQSLAADPVATLDTLLNAPSVVGTQAASSGSRAFTVSRVSDLKAGRQAVLRGDLSGLLSISSGSGGEISFTLYTDSSPTGRTAQLVQQAATSIAIQQRLARAGIEPASQAGLFAPAPYTIMSPDPARSEPKAPNLAQDVSGTLVNTGLVIFLFTAIVLYGNWVAMSVAEEKSSRVMEIILNAASPFELLTGKVLGVAAVAMLQYVIVVVPAVLVLMFQDRIAAWILNEPAGSIALPSGLTPPVLVSFGLFFVLGFLLYAVMYAAAGSLVSRQEDVNQVSMPMTLLAMVGYFVSVYASTGLLDAGTAWIVILSYVPFLSPYLMTSRVLMGQAAPWEPVLALAILAVSIVVALWVAARVYRAGVLMYGQRPGVRSTLRALRG